MKTTKIQCAVSLVICALAAANRAEARQACSVTPLLASNASEVSFFGRAVALDGDTLIVGAPGANGAIELQGAAYVFRWDGSGWSEEARLIASDGGRADQFGFAVAIDGDTALIGAYSDDHHAWGENQGSAYVFTRAGGVWTQQAKLIASDAMRGDYFGFSVALDGHTALIGAHLDDGPIAEGQGSTYVFTRSGANWYEQAKLAAPDAEFGGYFGIAVALSGDTALIGASHDDGAGGQDQGSAYVFTRGGTSWTLQAQLAAADGAPFDDFGRSVAIEGDTAFVGAPLKNGAVGFDPGSVYVFTRSDLVWTQSAELTAESPSQGAQFGSAVALAGETAIIGARTENGPAGIGQGAVYVLSRRHAVWTQQSVIRTTGEFATGDFGRAVALDADRALIGEYTYDGAAGADLGAAFVFRLDTADLNSDNRVNGADLAVLVAQWGSAGNADLTNDGSVDSADLTMLIAAWGQCE